MAQVPIGLPDVVYKLTSLNLFANYDLNKSATLRFRLIHARAKLAEWSWGCNGVPFVYSDNTTVKLKEEQETNFLGVAYIYKF